ncbi:transglycosylase [Paramesorhizobium deserti]|uniref:peptidoglycan lytic exotransglycosylase n=1 Tax=Paramesorhizobium deserti TaxID=1494590 RepID=A0A135I1C9_9HYPH|nr:murein transglycosylase A [Paramesorhizobium deserti]KXF79241.1 transglycosylase [Paramesorhizobium deserti]
MLSRLLRPVTYADCPGWHEDDHAGAFTAFRRSAFRVLEKPYRSGSLGIAFAALAPIFAAARDIPALGSLEACAFFEAHFLPCLLRPESGEKGFVTGFYEPEIAASSVRTDRFRIPFHRKPDDLVELDDQNRPADIDPSFAFARRCGSGLTEYHDRHAIETGALDGRNLEIAYVEDRVDAFFAHVQGAARLTMPDRSRRRITYAAKSGHPFTGPGRILIALGELAARDVTMQSIRAWFRENPHRIDEILWQNRSYIFFREAPVEDSELGPIAAAKVPLTPGRSIAVDRLLHTFGTPVFINAPDLDAFDPGNRGGLRRLMIAQDTGSAIVGPARGDLFAGSGDAAGEIAGVIRNKADFYVLVPRVLLKHDPEKLQTFRTRSCG